MNDFSFTVSPTRATASISFIARPPAFNVTGIAPT
jgi:hypothetical protein